MNLTPHFGLASNPKAFEHMTVLLVDAESGTRETIGTMLVEMGFKAIVEAENGQDALAKVKSGSPDLIIADWRLPELDGFALLEQTRSDSVKGTIPFIMTSSTVEQTLVVRAIKNGVSEFIIKPFSANILKDKIVRSLALTGLENPVEKEAEGGEQRLQILVVDDAVENIQLISEILHKDYKVKAATSGEQALKICALEPQPDLVLLDIMMLGMDGMEVCKKLKSDPRTQHITVIFLTALFQAEHIVRGLEMGAVDYITKPINPDIVKARVNIHAKIIQGTKMLRHQVDTMMENERLKESYNHILQNDLKHPLDEALKSLEQVEQQASDPLKVKQHVAQAKHACGYLSQLTENLLTLNSLEGGAYQLAPVELGTASLIAEVVDMYASALEEKSLTIDFANEAEVKLKGEAILTTSMLSNLLNNAIEAAPAGASIRISVTREGDSAVIAINNPGEIPQEIRNTFFDKHVTFGKKFGSGIGAYAAKVMAQAQNGSIGFESDKNAGTTLFVRLPACE